MSQRCPVCGRPYRGNCLACKKVGEAVIADIDKRRAEISQCTPETPYSPEAGETELAYYKRRFLEESTRVEADDGR